MLAGVALNLVSNLLFQEAFVLDVVSSYASSAQVNAALYVSLAAALGAFIGFEREVQRRSAGLRTHALIALACCLFIQLSFFMFDLFEQMHPGDALRIEPATVLNSVIIAMGFVAGGAILKDVAQGKIQNLTTACSVLCAGAVGLAVGLKLIVLAVASSFLVVAINWLGAYFERNVLGKPDQ